MLGVVGEPTLRLQPVNFLDSQWIRAETRHRDLRFEIGHKSRLMDARDKRQPKQETSQPSAKPAQLSAVVLLFSARACDVSSIDFAHRLDINSTHLDTQHNTTQHNTTLGYTTNTQRG